MKIPVTVTIETTQIDEDVYQKACDVPDGKTTICSVEGTLQKIKNGFQLEYNDGGNMYFGLNTVALFVFDKCSLLCCNGLFPISLTFEEGHAYDCIFADIGIEVNMHVFTRSIEKSLTMDGGIIKIDYLIEVTEYMPQHNSMKITVLPLEIAN